jgi:hypothetical protein
VIPNKAVKRYFIVKKDLASHVRGLDHPLLPLLGYFPLSPPVPLFIPLWGRASITPLSGDKGSTRSSPREGGLPLPPCPETGDPPVRPLVGAGSLHPPVSGQGVHPFVPS